MADGVHARTDGFTSLAVVFGPLGVWLGFPLADPIVGLVISAMIVVLLWGTARDVGTRLLDGVDPELTDRARQAVSRVVGEFPGELRLRWSGHRLAVGLSLAAAPDITIESFAAITDQVEAALRAELPAISEVRITAVPSRPRPA